MLSPKSLILIVYIWSYYSFSANSQSVLTQKKDSINRHKSGLGWGGTPILAYDSDLGLRYGALINLFDYGNGERYPKYLQYAKIKLYNSTKGTSNFSLVFDSDKILRDAKVIMEASYIKDIALNFYGFNGKNSRLINDLTNPDNLLYQNKFFYNHQRKWIRARIDIQKNTSLTGLRAYFGLTYNKLVIEAIDPEILNIPEGISGVIPSTESLYQSYVNWGVISEKEALGGMVNHLNAGVIYDTRNNQLNCNQGIWLETYLLYAPGLGANSNFAKHILTFRQYLNLPKTKMVFAYRVSSQQKLWGKIPFYSLPVYFDSQENKDGLGGAFTLRGIGRNRIASDGFVLGNMELRKKLFSFPLLRLNFDIELSLFADAAFITQEYKANYSKIPDEYRSIIIDDSYQRAYLSYGPGLYIIYNVNNIISINYGYSNDEQLGNRGLYIGSSFLF